MPTCHIVSVGDVSADHSGQRSEARIVFARSKAGIVGLSPTQGMDVCIVCIYSMFVLPRV
jgi:hypothetical protein